MRSMSMHSLCYAPYGYQAASQSESVLGFNGEYRELLSQGYLLGNGYRLYQTRICCFLSPDTLSPFGDGGLNCYAYCAGDPINKIDPSGRKGTGLKALIRQHGLNKTHAKKVLNGMPIPERDTHVQTKRYVDPNGKHLIVYRNNTGRFSAIPHSSDLQPFEATKLKRLIESQLTLIGETLPRRRIRTLLSGGGVQGGTKHLQGLEPSDYSSYRANSQAPMTGGTVLVKRIRQGSASHQDSLN
ncbi:RHS repeat-associated core domain-containing protein [Pseudomonas sp. NPDC089996]|uniref:RHS repeat-associated core domain-containing protein n=1 Tax=Pseudomonas sp. NPDC089996 TaxID=3364474 RepID=UPI0037FE5F06